MIATKSILAAASIFLALAGCKDLIPPSVTSTTPPDGAVDVSRSAEITATFDEDLFSETVDASTFVIAGEGDVNGAVTFDALTNIATFKPSAKLAPLTTYQATLTTGITDLVGNSLASDFNWSFTTADGAWGVAELLSDLGEAPDDQDRMGDFDVGIDEKGTALIVWQQDEDIWAAHYTVATGWQAPEMIGSGYDPHVAVNESGDAIVV